MIQLIGLNKELKVDVREKLSIIPKHYVDSMKNLGKTCDEVVVISTCNRTEIYFNSNNTGKKIVEDMFRALNWDIKFMPYTVHLCGSEVVEHLMNVVCGFDSQILGEDQILAQVKQAYENAMEAQTAKRELKKLFQTAITCGKEFRTMSSLNKIPVSSSSIAVNEARKQNAKRFMILGYGEVGQLTSKYVQSGDFDVLYIAVRNVDVVQTDDERVKAIPFAERKDYYSDVDCIISCTSAPHLVVKVEDMPQKQLVVFDLAVPRDVEESIRNMEMVQLMDIDDVSRIDDENRNRRKEIMMENRVVLKKFMEEYYEWNSVKDISKEIVKLKKCSEQVYEKRYSTFVNKKETKKPEELAKMLLKSTSDAFVNRAIEVLKEEMVKGRGDECLGIIGRIFYAAE